MELAILVLLITKSQASSKSFNCKFHDGGKWFDMSGLSRAKDYLFFNLDADDISGNLNFNFCKPAERPAECDEQPSSSGYFVSESFCYPLSLIDDVPEKTIWKYAMGRHGPHITAMNHNTNLKYSMQLNLHCALIGQSRGSDTINYDAGSKRFAITIYHYRGCGFYNFNFTKALFKMKWILCILGLIIGSYTNLFGMKYYQFTLALISGVSIGFMTLIVIYYLTGKSSDPLTMIYLVTIPITFGLFSLLFFYHNPLLALVIQGFCYGIMNNIMFKGFLMSFFGKMPSIGVICFMNFFFMTIGAILSVQASRPFSLFAMSFIGAFIIIRCVGLIIGNMPSEDNIEFEIQYGQNSDIPTEYYFYFCMTFALTFFGMFIQLLIEAFTNKKKNRGNQTNKTGNENRDLANGAKISDDS